MVMQASVGKVIQTSFFEFFEIARERRISRQVMAFQYFIEMRQVTLISIVIKVLQDMLE
jgi:hypothetical protein